MNNIILAIGAGRDGTTTLFNIIKSIFEKNKHTGTAYHQKDHKYFYNQYHLYKETGEATYIHNIQNRIQKWKIGDAIIGNGYAHILDQINHIHGSTIKIIHLKRNKTSWKTSFEKNVLSFPWSHGNYSTSELPNIYRIAAFHYGELTPDHWLELALPTKLEWYYDKTHNLIESHKELFKDVLNIETERLSNIKTLFQISEFINKDWKSIYQPIHVNISKLDYEKLPPDDRVIVGRFYQHFDFVASARHPINGENYFFNKILEGFLNRRSYDHSFVSAEELMEYSRNLKHRISFIRDLLKDQNNKGGSQ